MLNKKKTNHNNTKYWLLNVLLQIVPEYYSVQQQYLGIK